MSTGDRNALNVLGEHDKATTTGASDRARLGKLRDYLRGLPSLDFSDKGRATICQRFRVGPDELTATLAALQKPGQPTPDLLRVIGQAIGPTRKAKGGARRW